MKIKSKYSAGREQARRTGRRISQAITRLLFEAAPVFSGVECERRFGIPHQTISNWTFKEAERLRVILLKLGMMASAERELFMNRMYLQHPLPRHEFFDPDPLAREDFRRLTEKEFGLTVIVGKSDYWSSFVGSAIAHTYAEKDVDGVDGLDASGTNDLAPAPAGERCACLIPVPGVLLIQRKPGATNRESVENAWMKFAAGQKRTSP